MFQLYRPQISPIDDMRPPDQFLDDEERLRYSSSSLNPVFVVIVVIVAAISTFIKVEASIVEIEIRGCQNCH